MLGFTMLCFSAVNAYIGFSLIGERGEENKKKIREAWRTIEMRNEQEARAEQQMRSSK